MMVVENWVGVGILWPAATDLAYSPQGVFCGFPKGDKLYLKYYIHISVIE